MRHRVAGKQLSRTTSHRRALRRNQAASLFQHGAIRTTEVKAKELRRFVEKLITIAREGTLHARRRVLAQLRDRDAYAWDETEKDYLPEDKTIVQKLFDDIAPRYADRPGGYTRIIRLSDRRIGDAGVQVILQLVEEGGEGGSKTTTGRRKHRAAKRHAAAKKSAEASANDDAETPADDSPQDQAE
ncbi:MAG: 50S ribosomal protein L17 [Phycisphaerae bacterium]|nr:50S ribosomal protein L17 [Phycisphaerae bacterium]